MTDAEFFKQWQDTCPKSFKQFKMYMEDNYSLWNFNTESFIFYTNIIKMNFTMLTGVIEYFFEKENIFISVSRYNSGYNFWIDNEYNEIIIPYNPDIFFKTKNEAQQTAYLKAAEILEGRL